MWPFLPQTTGVNSAGWIYPDQRGRIYPERTPGISGNMACLHQPAKQIDIASQMLHELLNAVVW